MERVSTLREDFSISFSIRPQHIKPYLPPSLRLLRNTSNDHPSSANRQPPPLSLIADDMPERERTVEVGGQHFRFHTDSTTRRQAGTVLVRFLGHSEASGPRGRDTTEKGNGRLAESYTAAVAVHLR
ncbi:hypothetical protein LXL04_027950 [Taraxacum kok-saghyz]